MMAPDNDEETAGLLPNRFENDEPYDHDGNQGHQNPNKGGFYQSGVRSVGTDDSTSTTTKNSRVHRRHFSIDNYSIGSATTLGQLRTTPDQGMTQIRFQAALESPTVADVALGSGNSNDHGRFLMREIPHAPSTDPLLATGNRYVLDQSARDSDARAGLNRHVVVFEEGAVPEELLQRGQHHIVTINSTDGTVRMLSGSDSEGHVMQVQEQSGAEPEFSEEARRYVVILLDDDEAHYAGEEDNGSESD